MALKSALVYLGIGAVVHLFTMGTSIDFFNIWTYITVFLWPFVLFFKFLYYAVIVTIVAIIVVVVLAFFEGRGPFRITRRVD